MRTGNLLTQPIISVPPVDEDPDAVVHDGLGLDALEGGAEVCSWQVEPLQHGERLDKGLAVAVAGFSRSWLQQLVQEGLVLLNGQVSTKPSTRLKAGDHVQVTLKPPTQLSAFLPEPMPLQVMYEDEHLLVIDKPAGLVVHPAAGNWTGTLLNGLLAYHTVAAQLPRAGIVHRLDKDTSGLMVVGKTPIACEALVRQIAAREIHRLYVALVHGSLAAGSVRSVQGFIARDPRNRLRMAAVREGTAGARDTLTWVRCLDSGAVVSWVGCKLHTGRTHQIRVHLASLGHPLVGDALYGGRPLFGMARQALHAHRLVFRHPVTGAVVRAESPLPSDLTHALAEAGLQYNLDQLWEIDDELNVLSS